MKVVINQCYGGFGLSHEAVMRYLELAGKKVWPETTGKFAELTGPTYWLAPPEERTGILSDDEFRSAPIETRKASNKRYGEITVYPRDIRRDDPLLVRVVEEMGEKANGRCAELTVVEIPDGVDWEVSEYDGMERVEEKHRSWP